MCTGLRYKIVLLLRVKDAAFIRRMSKESYEKYGRIKGNNSVFSQTLSGQVNQFLVGN
jgi:hypothetical protein